MWITLELNTSQEAATIKLYVKEKYQESIQKIEKELSRRLTFFKWHYPSCLVLRKWVMNLIKFSEEKTTFNFWYKTVSKANCFGRYSTISALRVAWNVTSPRPRPPPQDLFIMNRPKSFQNSTVIETSLSDFHKMSLTVMKAFLQKATPQNCKISKLS